MRNNQDIDPRDDPEVKKLISNIDHVGKVVGIVKIQVFDDATGKLIHEQIDKNLITYGIRDVLGELLIQQSLLPAARTTAQLQVKELQMGTSNATPTRAQTTLQSVAAITKVLAPANVSKSSAGVYVFTVSMGVGEGIGTTFTEVGLFTNDGTMLSRQVHGDYTKGAGQTVQYTWTYVWT